MCSMSALKCPLCAQTNFPSIDALRVSLIKVANGPLVCPICHELFLGLDKLTIHLFSHTSTVTTAAAIVPTSATAAATTTSTTAMALSKSTLATPPKAEVSVETADTSIANASAPKRASKEKKSKKSRQQSDVAINQLPKDTNNASPKQPSPTLKNGALEATNAAGSTTNDNNTNASTTNVSTHPETLSTCDICEFTFRDADLRDMHCRLVHRNFGNLTAQEATATATAASASEADFKCHLCTKTFKMKGSLRVHLKVVHLMSLPHAGNAPKLSICDRIRHKETKSVAYKTTNINAVATPQVKLDANQSASGLAHSQPTQSLLQTPSMQQTCNIAIATNGTTQMPNGFTFGTLTLLPANANVAGSLLNIGGGIGGAAVTDGAVDNAALNSNVLLVFNANAAATATSVMPTAATAPINGFKTETQAQELDMDMQSKGNSTGNPKTWECDVCTKAFTTKYFLKKHKRLHTGEMPYTCEICARTFTFQQSYHKHLLYHSNEKPHVCATCGRAFKELSTLHNHERIHSGEKPFKCEVCDKCFRQRVSFLVHTRIHTGVKPYKCEVCEKSFRYKVSQRTHKCQPFSDTPDATDDTNSACVDSQSNKSVDHHNNKTADDISECFIKEFLENTKAHLGDAQCSPASAEIAAITADDCHDGPVSEALLTKAIDDIVVESCNKMGIGNQVVPGPHLPHTNLMTRSSIDDGCNSPTQQLQNMRLYSPQLVPDMIDDPAAEHVDSADIFPRFLLDDVENNML